VQYSTEGKIKEPNFAADTGKGLLKAVASYATGDVAGAMKSAIGLVKTNTKKRNAEKVSKATKTSPADCVSSVPFLFAHAPPLTLVL
jgi:phage-related minor tail protein